MRRGRCDRALPKGRQMKFGTYTISVADVALVVLTVFVVLAYFNGWG